MNILLLGKNGQVGWELNRTLACLGNVTAFDQPDLDLANPIALRQIVQQIKPDLIVNAAAYTVVDQAEQETELAMAINGIAPGILAEEATRLKAGIIHYSTDYVFDGQKSTPYNEEDETKPLNVYGQTKLAGERAIQATGAPHLIFRTSWVYGSRGKNFFRTIIRLAEEKEELSIVDDQIGAPTCSRMLAEATALIISQGIKNDLSQFLTKHSGIYHMTMAGSTSWYGFAKAIVETRNLDVKLVPISSGEYKTAAARPNYSVLSNDKLYNAFGLRLPSWEAALAMI